MSKLFRSLYQSLLIILKHTTRNLKNQDELKITSHRKVGSILGLLVQDVKRGENMCSCRMVPSVGWCLPILTRVGLAPRVVQL